MSHSSVKRHFGSSRRNCITPSSASRSTWHDSSPWRISVAVTASGSAAATYSASCWSVSSINFEPLGSPPEPALALDLLLQEQDAVEQRLGGWRAARHIDVDRHDAVAAAHHRVGIMVIAAAVGARAHRDDPARLGHLVVDLAQSGGH